MVREWMVLRSLCSRPSGGWLTMEVRMLNQYYSTTQSEGAGITGHEYRVTFQGYAVRYDVRGAPRPPLSNSCRFLLSRGPPGARLAAPHTLPAELRDLAVRWAELATRFRAKQRCEEQDPRKHKWRCGHCQPTVARPSSGGPLVCSRHSCQQKGQAPARSPGLLGCEFAHPQRAPKPAV